MLFKVLEVLEYEEGPGVGLGRGELPMVWLGHEVLPMVWLEKVVEDLKTRKLLMVLSCWRRSLSSLHGGRRSS